MLAKVLVGCAAILGCAAIPAAASASVVVGSQSALEGLPWAGTPGVPARSIQSITTSFDKTAGLWTTTIQFYGAQSAATQAKLYLSLGESSEAAMAPGVGVTVWTDPADPRTTPLDSTGTPTVAATFSSDLKMLTLTVSDPGLIGVPLNELNQPRLSKSNVLFDLFPSMTLYAPAGEGVGPTIRLPSSDRSLVLGVHGISLKLGDGSISHPSSVAAFVEVDNKLVASGQINLGPGIPETLPLGVPRDAVLPRRGRHAAKLIVVAYSPTGISTTLTRAVTLTT